MTEAKRTTDHEAIRENDLAFLYQERTEGGGISRFHKVIARDGR